MLRMSRVERIVDHPILFQICVSLYLIMCTMVSGHCPHPSGTGSVATTTTALQHCSLEVGAHRGL